MAPKNEGTHTVDRTPEWTKFIADLTDYHAKRGTNFDPEPKVGMVHIDLVKLFHHIVQNGGYDKVSAEKLAWRRMIKELLIPTTNESQASFQLKTVFYKYLAAYEITTIHGKEPPPKDILEDQTAKGGSLLTRTYENNPFKMGPSNGDGTDQSGDDSTPVRERPAPTVSSARASRGLREAPPQRVLFQPDTGPTRTTTRHSSTQHASNSTPTASQHNHSTPTSHAHAASAAAAAAAHSLHQPRGPSAVNNPAIQDNISASVSSYEPKSNIIVPVMALDTPNNNPAEFAKRRHRRLLTAIGDDGSAAKAAPRLPMRYDGPNIYNRCLLSLRSAIPEEQAFALTHLVRISYERGDKYKFESFPGLSDGLIDKALEVGKIFYGANWTVSYNPADSDNNIEALDGLEGTYDILERISFLSRNAVQDAIISAEWQDLTTQVTEAILTMRNMVQLPDNAVYMADSFPLLDLLCIILNLPDVDAAIEMKHYALDIAECITPYLALASDAPIYISLVQQLESTDRGIILTAMRALARISMNLETTNTLGGIPPGALKNMAAWVLLNDEELVDASLDFFYQYTAVVSNVEALLESIQPEMLISHLVRLLAHGAKKVTDAVVVAPARVTPPLQTVAMIPEDLRLRLINQQEPQRCMAWIKALFEEDPDSVMTQMTVWQAYQRCFSQALQQAGKPMISPSDFIRHITTVYPPAAAQIVREANGNKFVVKGIRPRLYPRGIDGRSYYPCQWIINRTRRCGEAFNDSADHYKHICTQHLGMKAVEGPDAPSSTSTDEYCCRWARCTKHPEPTQMALRDILLHVKMHAMAKPAEPILMQTSGREDKWVRRSYIEPAKTITLQFEETLSTRDERNQIQAAGIPLSAALVLCNLARNMPKTESEEKLLRRHERGGEAGGWNERLFRPVMPRLHEVATENRALAPYMTRLFSLSGFYDEDSI